MPSFLLPLISLFDSIFSNICDHNMHEHYQADVLDHTYKNVVCINQMEDQPAKSMVYLIQMHLLEKTPANHVEVMPIYSAPAYVDYTNITEDSLTTVDVITPLTLDVEQLRWNYILSCESKANFFNIKPHYWDFVLMVTLSDDVSLNLPDIQLEEDRKWKDAIFKAHNDVINRSFLFLYFLQVHCLTKSQT